MFKSSRTLNVGDKVFPYIHRFPDGNKFRDEPAAIIGPNGTRYVPVSQGDQVMLIRAEDLTKLAAVVVPVRPAPEPASVEPTPTSPANTLSEDAWFFPVNDWQFQNPDNPNCEAQLKTRIKYYEDHPGSGAVRLLKGAAYNPGLTDPNDPDSVKTAEDADGNLYVLVTIHEGGSEKHGAILKGQYDSDRQNGRGK